MMLTVGKTLLVFIVVISFAIAIPGCRDQKEPSSQTQSDSIKIGVLYPMTGYSASSGNDAIAGLNLALEIINNSYEVGIPLAKEKGLRLHSNTPLELVVVDTESDVKKVPNLVKRLIHEEKVAALMGCYNSAVTAVASEQAEIHKIPFLNATSTSPLLVKRGLKWFFRTTPDDEMFARNFFQFLGEVSESMDQPIQKRLTLIYENRLWGTSVSQAEKRLARQNEYQIVADIPYDAAETNFDLELEQTKRSMPAVILQTSYDKDAVLYMKGYRNQGIHPLAILAMDAGFVSPSFIKELGLDAEFILSREVWALDLSGKKPLIGEINHLFQKKYYRDMTGTSARTFTGLMVLAGAINRAQSLLPEEIRNALVETDITPEKLIMPWDGVRFDPETGQNIRGSGLIVQIQNGKYRTIWPKELAGANLIWPFPGWGQRSEVKADRKE